MTNLPEDQAFLIAEMPEDYQGDGEDDDPPPACDHDWRVEDDYEGDPGVYNGINKFLIIECRKCGKDGTIKDIQQYEY